jgi:hypothetical protein
MTRQAILDLIKYFEQRAFSTGRFDHYSDLIITLQELL